MTYTGKAVHIMSYCLGEHSTPWDQHICLCMPRVHEDRSIHCSKQQGKPLVQEQGHSHKLNHKLIHMCYTPTQQDTWLKHLYRVFGLLSPLIKTN